MGVHRIILWLRNDLRLHDNALFYEAVQRVKNGKATEVLPVFVLDERWYRDTKLGFCKTGALRSKFLLEAVNDLKTRLRSIDSDLLVAVGRPESVLPSLLVGKDETAPTLGNSNTILYSQEVTSEERAVEVKVRAACGSQAVLEGLWNATLIHINDLPFDVQHTPDAFTPFRTRVEEHATPRHLLPTPSRGQLPLPGANKKGTARRDVGAGGGKGSVGVSCSEDNTKRTLSWPATAGTAPEKHRSGTSIEFSNANGVCDDSAYAADLTKEPATPNKAVFSKNIGPSSFDAFLSWDGIPVWGKRMPSPPIIDERAVLQFVGGESHALLRLDYYINKETKLVARYFETRNGMLGGDYSTKFAPWLALGCLSPRLIYHRIKDFEKLTGLANKSTYWVVFELLWRDFFRFFAMKHGSKIFLPGGPIDSPKRWNRDMGTFRQWVEGHTGAPLVDACMRELSTTGFMSNRGRQNVASFLVHNLGLDWRLGAAYFESVLLDYDVCSNYGNWVAAAGLTGGRINLFNIVKQSLEYDPDGSFVRLWVPELARVPGSRIHTPHRLSDKEQREFSVSIGRDYPYCRALESMATTAGGAGPESAQARWSQQRYQRPGKVFKPKSDFEKYG